MLVKLQACYRSLLQVLVKTGSAYSIPGSSFIEVVKVLLSQQFKTISADIFCLLVTDIGWQYWKLVGFLFVVKNCSYQNPKNHLLIRTMSLFSVCRRFLRIIKDLLVYYDLNILQLAPTNLWFKYSFSRVFITLLLAFFSKFTIWSIHLVW